MYGPGCVLCACVLCRVSLACKEGSAVNVPFLVSCDGGGGQLAKKTDAWY